MNSTHYAIADQVRHDRNQLTPATDHWIIAFASRSDWRTPPEARGKDRLRVLGRYVACVSALGIAPLPISRHGESTDVVHAHLYGRLFPDHDAVSIPIGAIQHRMNQITLASMDLASLIDDCKVRIPAVGSIHEMREVNLREEILIEARGILTDLVVGVDERNKRCAPGAA